MNKDRTKKALWWDRALSIVGGCSPISDGCRSCWSAAQTHMRGKQKNEKIRSANEGLTDFINHQFNGKIRLMWDDIEKPLKIKKPTVWAVWNDLFHDNIPVKFIDKFLDVVSVCKQHSFLVLTKRSENIFEKLYGYEHTWDIRDLGGGDYYENLYIGVTVENQKYVNRIADLTAAYPGPKFLSIEPILGPIDIEEDLPEIKGIICGGESGKNARELNLDWVRNLRDQCIRTNTPFFFKQTSGFRPEKLPELDGKVWDQLAWVRDIDD